QNNRVVEIDRDLNVVDQWDVGDQPQWLALHPSERAVFVASARNARLTRIDRNSGEMTVIEMPTVVTITDLGEVELTPRFTGDPTIMPDGKTLLVPLIYVDNQTPVETPVDGKPVPNGYSSSGLNIGRVNPGVARVPLNHRGERDKELDTLAVFIGSVLDNKIVRSYPSSVTADPRGGRVLVTMESSDVVVGVELGPFRGERETMSEGAGTSGFSDTGRLGGGFIPSMGTKAAGMTDRALIAQHTGAGPRGIAFTGKDDAFVHAGFDRTLSAWNVESVREALVDISGFQGRTNVDKLDQSTVIEQSSLSPEVEEGRRLFYSATDKRVAAEGAGVSCSTCHMEGRDDGLTWSFEIGLRQTPSLAGLVSATAPVTWTDGVDSVATEAQLTTELRMGGVGLLDSEAALVASYVDWSRPVDVGGDDKDDVIERGRVIFERPDVGCTLCHSGATYTDNRDYVLYDKNSFNTPSLAGVSATAPYFHDGSSETLRDVIERSEDGIMGDTSMLSTSEIDELEAYLRSL
ncbi:MAG: hypothetical protein GWP91_25980, partial [Rhodobacterales bacterium]|nr:hypothetical protein [Rhodobacterales bacterium]